jgi:hypothetical protein
LSSIVEKLLRGDEYSRNCKTAERSYMAWDEEKGEKTAS